MKPPRPLVAVGGNPNAGKTTLFNVLTGSRARVGNYPGVTVDKRLGTATVPGEGVVEILDVPGTYSLVARTGEEQIAISALMGLNGNARPDVIVLCVDATQLVRGNYLVLQAQELGLPVVVALTMMDEAKGATPDVAKVAQRLGCEVIPVIAPKGAGIPQLLAAIGRKLKAPATTERWSWTPPSKLRGQIETVRPALPPEWPHNDAMALWALMSVEEGDELTDIPASLRQAIALSPGDQLQLDEEAIRGRYAFLDRELAPLVPQEPDRRQSAAVDRVLIHPVFGLLIFAALMFGIFQALFTGSEPMVEAIEDLFKATGKSVKPLLGAGLLADLVSDGLIGGVGAVIVFLPQIMMLFFFLGLLEDSGYMARVAYLMDRIMRGMNLHGRAFVPMLSGFACAVPAILATRTMERRRDRLLTMLVVPLTTCSARLPVYTLIIASLFPPKRLLGLFPVQGLLMVFMYVFGMGTALAAAWILSKAIKPLRAKRLPFVIELPPYRIPRLRDVLHTVWDRSKKFLTEAGTVIVVGSVVLWALLAFPREIPHPSRDWAAAQIVAAQDGSQTEIVAQQEAERVRQSYAGRFGVALEPIIAPLGFDWKIGIGLIGAFAAREVFVSTVGVIYGVGPDADEEDLSLREKLRQERRPDGKPVYTPLVGLSLMLFFALSCQCLSTLAVIKRETASWRWPAFVFAYMTALGWLVSLTVYQGGRLLGWS